MAGANGEGSGEGLAGVVAVADGERGCAFRSAVIAPSVALSGGVG